jgi:hypothetical protein
MKSKEFELVVIFGRNFAITCIEWEGDEEEGGQKKKRKIHKPRSYHYKIGEYNESTFFKNISVTKWCVFQDKQGMQQFAISLLLNH